MCNTSFGVPDTLSKGHIPWLGYKPQGTKENSLTNRASCGLRGMSGLWGAHNSTSLKKSKSNTTNNSGSNTRSDSNSNTYEL